MPENLGVVDGKLTACPDKPNCVSTQAEQLSQKVEPLAMVGDAEQGLKTLKRIVVSDLGGKIVKEEGLYFHAEFRSRIFRFVDDFECLIVTEAGSPVAHFRSASRVGHSDLGVNRKRVERVCKLYQQSADKK